MVFLVPCLSQRCVFCVVNGPERGAECRPCPCERGGCGRPPGDGSQEQTSPRPDPQPWGPRVPRQSINEASLKRNAQGRARADQPEKARCPEALGHPAVESAGGMGQDLLVQGFGDSVEHEDTEWREVTGFSPQGGAGGSPDAERRCHLSVQARPSWWPFEQAPLYCRPCLGHNGICLRRDNGPLLGAALPSTRDADRRLGCCHLAGADFLLSGQSQMAACDLPGRTTERFSFPGASLGPGLPRPGHAAG